MAYSNKVIDHYENPRNVGSFDKGEDDIGTGLGRAEHAHQRDAGNDTSKVLHGHHVAPGCDGRHPREGGHGRDCWVT